MYPCECKKPMKTFGINVSPVRVWRQYHTVSEHKRSCRARNARQIIRDTGQRTALSSRFALIVAEIVHSCGTELGCKNHFTAEMWLQRCSPHLLMLTPKQIFKRKSVEGQAWDEARVCTLAGTRVDLNNNFRALQNGRYKFHTSLKHNFHFWNYEYLTAPVVVNTNGPMPVSYKLRFSHSKSITHTGLHSIAIENALFWITTKGLFAVLHFPGLLSSWMLRLFHERSA